MNYELNELTGNADLVRFIKSRRIAWLGHVMRMDDKRTPKRILKWKPIGRRTRGRTRKRWIAGIEEDLQIMGVRRWRSQYNPLNPELNPICYLLALLGAHHFLHVSRIRVK